MKAVILAAGKGSRLRPLTDDKPKCMVEVLGKPMIKWTHDILIDMGIKDIIIISGYYEHILLEYAKENLKGCRFITQDQQTGTADAIHLAKEYIKDSFICLPGDCIFSKCDLSKLRSLRNSLLYSKQYDKLEEFGTLDLHGDMILNINEKSTEPSSNFINCSAYHFTPTIFSFIPKTEIDERFNERIITNTINLMIDSGISFYGIPIKERNEVSYPEDIKVVEKRLESKMTPEDEERVKERMRRLGYLK